MDRSINWIPASNCENFEVLKELQNRMVSYYSSPDMRYYSDIDIVPDIWSKSENLPQRDIIDLCKKSSKILEVGCGSANILSERVFSQSNYTGIDFSEQLININSNKYPYAHFEVIRNPNRFNFPDKTFDLVFSHFVLEHVIFPQQFLDECLRILKQNGILIILCPDFLGNNNITSQRVGYSEGSGSDKMMKGRFLDAFVTGFDTRVKLPLICRQKRRIAKRQPQFYINTQPICFTDAFRPDVDAVYVTYKEEIVKYVGSKIKWLHLGKEVETFCKRDRLIYLKGKKC